MCGIFGYVGQSKQPNFIINGLKKIEYRGYDSAGLSIINNQQITTVKSVGRVEKLATKIADLQPSLIGIGHTRWATHGEPSDVNSHPHLSQNGQISIVHNGIIENYQNLKNDLINKGYNFVSQTDSEVIANLLEYNSKSNDFLNAIKQTISQIEGSYAVAIINSELPDQIFTVAHQSPLILGLADQFKLLSSDITAIIEYTNKVHYMVDDELAILTKNQIEMLDLNTLKPIEFKVDTLDQTNEAVELGDFADFTSKEIHSQSAVIKNILAQYFSDNQILLELEFKKYDKIVISACGTAYHAGLVGKYYFENIADIPVTVELASEFNYKKVFVNDKTLFIAISQSGETRDTLNAMLKAKRMGATCLALVNVIGSQIARKADQVIYTLAGTEIGVASTKAYLSQVVCLFLIANKIAKQEIDYLNQLPNQINEVMTVEAQIEQISKDLINQKIVFFTGRGVDIETSLEASLKLKELSYINSFAIGAGELKHGTIALIDPKTTAIAVLTQADLVEKTVSNLKEINARKGKIVIVTNLEHDFSDLTEDVVKIPKLNPLLAPLVSIIPLQMLAYHSAKLLKRDVDKPRNLAKSVTVE